MCAHVCLCVCEHVCGRVECACVNMFVVIVCLDNVLNVCVGIPSMVVSA